MSKVSSAHETASSMLAGTYPALYCDLVAIQLLKTGSIEAICMSLSVIIANTALLETYQMLSGEQAGSSNRL